MGAAREQRGAYIHERGAAREWPELTSLISACATLDDCLKPGDLSRFLSLAITLQCERFVIRTD